MTSININQAKFNEHNNKGQIEIQFLGKYMYVYKTKHKYCRLRVSLNKTYLKSKAQIFWLNNSM